MKGFVYKNMSKTTFDILFATIFVEEMMGGEIIPSDVFKNTKINKLLNHASTHAQTINEKVLMVIINRARCDNDKDDIFRVRSKEKTDQRIGQGILIAIIILFLTLNQVRIDNYQLINEYKF